MGFLRKLGGVTPFGILTNQLLKKNKNKDSSSKPTPSLTTEGYSSRDQSSLISKPQIY